jgi:hypothetical protein
MDLTAMLEKIEPKLPSLRAKERAILQPLVDHMHAGVIRPVTDDERSMLIRLSGGAQ